MSGIKDLNQAYLAQLASLTGREFSEEHAPLVEAAATVLLRQLSDYYVPKSLGYGAYNTSKHGLMGIEVRLSDKVERLYHLLRGGEELPGDSVRDQLHDILGYALLGLMQVNGALPQSRP